ncbi:unnamed protein product [Rhizopus stolonifer]
MNNILDLSDISESSQLSVETQEKSRQMFSHCHIITPCTEQGFEEIQNELLHTSNDNGRYFKRYLDKLDMFKTKEKYSTAKRRYVTILKLMLYDSYSFDV